MAGVARPVSRLVVSAALLAPLAPGAAAAGASDRATRHISYSQWTTTAQLQAGQRNGTAVQRGSLRIGKPVGTIRYDDPYGSTTRRYDFARWVSRWRTPRFSLTELIASWNAHTPHGTWVKVEARARTAKGRIGSWDTLGHWASHDAGFHRMTLGRQRDDLTRVAVDTMLARPGYKLSGWQLRLTLLRRSGTSKTPRVDSVGAVVSRMPHVSSVPTSAPGVARGIRLSVPRYSQMIHKGEYPQWDGGGEAWCSPTSVAMLLGYWGRGPTPKQYAWVPDAFRQPWVDYAARNVFDYGFDGAGNWPFNTAYAARFGLHTYVTQLRSLRTAERFIKAGIPLAASIAFGPGELDGAPINSTSGHVVVVSGFTAKGNVVVNDPAAPRARGVVRVYDRGQFENAWIAHTGGVAYVVHSPGRGVPRAAG